MYSELRPTDTREPGREIALLALYQSECQS